MYSVFSILDSGREDVIGELYNPIALSEKELLHANFMYPILDKLGCNPLRVSVVNYGSPLTIDLEGLWKPLEIVRDIIKDIIWRGSHEREMAKMERLKMQMEIVEHYMDLVIKTKKLKLPREKQLQLVDAMQPQLTALNTALMSTPKKHEKKKPWSHQRHFRSRDRYHGE